MARKKKTPVQIAYAKERKRIRSYINKYQKRGFDIGVELPAIPKRITQGSVNRLKRITPAYIQERSRAIDLETGEIVSGTTALKESRRRSRKNAEDVSRETMQPPTGASFSREPLQQEDYNQVIINNFLETASKLPHRVAEFLKRVIRDALHQVDPEDVVEALMSTSPRFDDLMTRMSYDSQGAAEEYSAAFLSALPGISPGLRDDLELAYEEYSW